MKTPKTEALNLEKVYRALRRSRVRNDLYAHLCDIYPRGESMEELRELTGLKKAAVFGALAGTRKGYCTCDSLVSLGLATYEPVVAGGRVVDVFRATKLGLRLRDELREYGESLTMSYGTASLGFTKTCASPAG